MKAGITAGLRVAAWAAGSLLLVGAVAGTASAATHHSAKKTTAKDTTSAGSGDASTARPPHMLHGTATVETSDGTFEDYASQVGTVKTVSATSITVVSDDEFSATYTLDDSTHIVKNGAKSAASDIATGDTVMVQAEREDAGYTADSIFDGKPPAGGPAGHAGPGGPGGPGHGGPPPGAS